MSDQAAVPGTAAPEVAPRTIDSELDTLFGDRAPSAPEPEPETPSDGTTPAAADPAPDTPSDAETETPVVDSETPPSEGSTPDAAATVEDDPFKDTTAAEYVINGKSVPVEDIRVFAEGGAVIRPESLPNILSKLAERDTLSERYRTRDTEYQTLAKATEWTTTRDGKEVTLTGPEAAIELRIGNAGLFAENKLMVERVINAEDLQPLLTTAPVLDKQGRAVLDAQGNPVERVVFRTDAIEQLRRENALQQREVAAAIRDHFKTALQVVPSTSVDYATAGPPLIEQVAKAANLDASVLTPQDKSILVKHLPFHTRDGLASVEWQELVKDRIQERLAAKTTQSKVADATTKAIKEGQARMAAAARGVKPNVARATPPKPAVASPVVERMADEGALFDAMMRSGANAMRAAER